MVAHLEPLHAYKLICTEEKINEQTVGEKNFPFCNIHAVWFMVVYCV